jgi:hypothetical protein
MFTQRFVKLPIKLYDVDHKELTGAEITKDTYQCINPFEISAYRPSDENEGICTHVTFKNGEHMLIYLHISDFEKTLNDHMKISI